MPRVSYDTAAQADEGTYTEEVLVTQVRAGDESAIAQRQRGAFSQRVMLEPG